MNIQIIKDNTNKERYAVSDISSNAVMGSIQATCMGSIVIDKKRYYLFPISDWNRNNLEREKRRDDKEKEKEELLNKQRLEKERLRKIEEEKRKREEQDFQNKSLLADKVLNNHYASYQEVQEIFSDFKNKRSYVNFESKCNCMMEHQKMGSRIAESHNRFAFFYDTGTGKTLLALDIIQKKEERKGAHFLIICPKTIINTAWMDDCERFFPYMKIMPLTRGANMESYTDVYNRWKRSGALEHGNSFDTVYLRYYFEKCLNPEIRTAKQLLMKEADHFIINPEAFRNLKDRDIFEIDNKHITGLIIDESAVVKNRDSKLFKKLYPLGRKFDYLYLLSGKPAPNRISEYKSQIAMVAPDLYETFLKNDDESFWQRYSIREQFYNGQLESNNILTMLKYVSVTVSKDDCMDLPETTEIVRKIQLNDYARKKYNEVATTTWQAIKKTQDEEGSVIFILGNFAYLREVANGFLIQKEYSIDKDGKRKVANEAVEEIHEQKIEELFNIIDELGDQQALIWCQYIRDIELIEQRLKEKGYSVVTAYGKTEDKDKSINTFKSGEARFMIAHPKTLQYGVTLTNCTYAIYYSTSYSFEEYYQSHDRIYRKGQTKSCTFIFLQAEDTIDEIMFKAIKKKLSNSEFCELVLKDLKDLCEGDPK